MTLRHRLLSELSFADIIDQLNDGILMVDLKGELIYANERMGQTLGYEPEAMLGRHLFDFMTPEWAERARVNLAARAKGNEDSFDHQFVHRDGFAVWVMVSPKVYEVASGERISVVAIRDITARVEMEELRLEAIARREAEHQAKTASRSKSAFLAHMSHELRTPLNAIIGYVDLLLEEHEEGEFTDPSADLERVRGAGRHLLDLINGVLDLSKVESGRMELHPTTFEFDALLEEVRSIITPMATLRCNRFVIDDEAPLAFHGDRIKLKQVIINLLSNACKFTDHGEVEFHVEELAARETILFEVMDTGVGISPEDLERIFEPFSQVSQAKGQVEGTGLGLSLSQHFVALMGGTLEVESIQGVGTRFWFELPHTTHPTTGASMTEHVTSKDGTQIAYTTVGEGSETCVLVHGWMVSGDVYHTMTDLLDTSTYRFVIPDLRATGASSPGADGYALDRYVEDVEAVLGAVDGQVHLFGHSMGGQIAQLVAARHPDRIASLTLMCPVPVSGIPLPDEVKGIFSTSGEDRGKQDQILNMATLDLADDHRARLLDDAGTIPAAAIAASLESWTTGGDVAELANITARTLVVGSDDPFLPPDFLNAAVVGPIANASFVHVPEAGHYVQLERAEATAGAVSEFLGG